MEEVVIMKRYSKKDITELDYIHSGNEFKSIIDLWCKLYRKTSHSFGAASTHKFFEVGTRLEKGAIIFDEMMCSDFPLSKYEPVNIYFSNAVESLNPDYNITMEDKEITCPDPGKLIPVCIYGNIAAQLRAFHKILSEFSIGLQKYHGKTKIRVLLDCNTPMDMFYFGLESRMYNENQTSGELENVF